MTTYCLVEMTPEAAEQHDRRVHDIPPDVGLGWIPYTHRLSADAISRCAGFSLAEIGRRVQLPDPMPWTAWRAGARWALWRD